MARSESLSSSLLSLLKNTVLVVDHSRFVVDALAGLQVFAFRMLHLDNAKRLRLQC